MIFLLAKLYSENLESGITLDIKGLATLKRQVGKLWGYDDLNADFAAQ